MDRAAWFERSPPTHPQLRRIPHGRRRIAARGRVGVPPALRARRQSRAAPVEFVPIRSDLLRAFAPAAAGVLAFLLVFGLLGGWILAGRMLAPLTRITDATRMATNGSLSHRIRLPGRNDEFRELADAFDTMLARLEAHVAEQQRFAANASHELRTPLAISKTLLDVARTDPNQRHRRSSSTASTPSTPERSTSPKHCSCSAAPTSGPSPENPSTCPSWRKKPPKRSSPSRKSTASPSKPPATSPRRSDRTRSCCS